MGLMIAHEPAPLGATPDGVVRVGGTRVTLDTVVAAFLEGATAEEIAYPVLALADVYAAIGYYLRHRSEVEAYLDQRRQTAERVQCENAARFDPADIRARLLSRRTAGVRPSMLKLAADENFNKAEYRWNRRHPMSGVCASPKLIKAYPDTVALRLKPGKHSRVAVKIVGGRGIESLKVVEVHREDA